MPITELTENIKANLKRVLIKEPSPICNGKTGIFAVNTFSVLMVLRAGIGIELSEPVQVGDRFLTDDESPSLDTPKPEVKQNAPIPPPPLSKPSGSYVTRKPGAK
jgi:hypothetical protein